MSLTPSTMLELGTAAPNFDLMDLEGNWVNLQSIDNNKALLIVFMCNHCPYVRHVIDDFALLAKEYQKKGISVVGINSNDFETYEDDGPEKMIEFSKEKGFSFPYLLDDTQSTAKAYKAACTPDFFLFDSSLKLVYRGQMDDARPGNENPITGKDLRAALNAVLGNTPIPEVQKPSMGCNIKWKKGNEPSYF